MVELGGDAIGAVEVTPPDFDDFPPQRSKHATPAGVTMLGIRRRMPSPRLALDPDPATRLGEVEFGDQHASLVVNGMLLDESDPTSLEDLFRQPLEPTPWEAATVTLVEQHQQRRRPGPSAPPPTVRHLAQLVEIGAEA